jgi:energy-coupling factor transporter transmembrane protein EcfT
MAIADITFLLIVLGLAVLFTVMVFIWKGTVWMSIVSAVMWFLIGFFFIMRTQEGTELLAYQEYIQLLMIGIGFVMMFSPIWLRSKDADLEKNAPQDIDIWGEDAFNKHIEERKRDKENRR